jgi:urease accessory protein UreF
MNTKKTPETTPSTKSDGTSNGTDKTENTNENKQTGIKSITISVMLEKSDVYRKYWCQVAEDAEGNLYIENARDAEKWGYEVMDMLDTLLSESKHNF